MQVRIETLLSIGKGLATAIVITLAGMAVFAAAIIFLPISDGALVVMNQVLKVVSIFAGTVMAVGLGGKRGFAYGAVVGLVYMVLGYALYCLLDGALVSPTQMVGEFLMGVVIGALSGAVVANLKPGKRKAHGRMGRIRAI